MSIVPRRHASKMPFYRSQVTRYAFIVTGGFAAYALSPLGSPAWRDTPSLHWLHMFFPWPVLYGLMTVYVGLQLTGRLALVGLADALGLVVYGWELVALIFTLSRDNPTNPLSIGAVALAVVLHYAALRLVVFHMFGGVNVDAK